MFRENKAYNENKGTFVLLSLGSNLGQRRIIIDRAIERLTEMGVIYQPKVSSYYKTEPVGHKEQPDFINIAASGYTDYPLNVLINEIKDLEEKLGRVKRKRWHEREIDIDIILYGNKKVNSDDLQVPHPRMHKRRFVLLPAAEIAGERIHPDFRMTINELLGACRDDSEVEIMKN